MREAPAAGDGTDFRLAPAMINHGQPNWPGARWVGSVDLLSLRGHTRVVLLKSDGYQRARLLIREGPLVHGFVDVDATGGHVERDKLESAVVRRPTLATVPGAAATPGITVVVCTRDRASLLRTSLASILGLDYPDFDIVVVDNASRTRATINMVHTEFSDPRIRLIEEPVPGLSQARNTGLHHARGDIVAFTDDDTFVDRAWLREIAAGFERAPNVACVSGLVASGELRSRTQAYFDKHVSWSDNLVPRVFSLAQPPADLPMFPFTVGAFGTGANFALDRRAALNLGGFDTALGAGTRTGGGEDIDMFTRVLLDGHLLVLQPSAIVWHRHRDDFAELRSQVRAYGNGLGAWITKIMTNPQTASLALARSPYALRRLVSLAKGPEWRALPSTRDENDWKATSLGRLELYSVAVGSLLYFRELAARRRKSHG